MKRQKATIIGSEGFIGRHLATRLNNEGWDCNLPPRGWVPDGRENLGHVFYCAGLTADYLQRPFDTVEAHVSFLSTVLKNGHFDSLVYLSSTRLYDSQPEIEASEHNSLVLEPSNPRHIYDLSKSLGESLCTVTGAGRARVARLSCVYKDHTDQDGFLPGLLRQLVDSRPPALDIDSSPAYARDYVYLEDVLDGLILIATRGTQTIYNVASGENVSNRTLFETISRASGCKIKALQRDASPPPPPQISIKRMKDEFNWHPQPVLNKISSILLENML